jgi:thiol-disulfide isomerase/thioredoxin
MKILSPSRIHLVAAVAVALMVFAARHSRAEDPTTQPTVASSEALQADFTNQFEKMQDLLTEPDTLTDAAKRKDVAPEIVPILKKGLADLDALAAADPSYVDEAADRKSEMLITLALFGDVDANKAIAAEANSDNDDTVVEGKRSQLMVAWINAKDDEIAQDAIVDKIEALAKDHIVNASLTMQMVEMRRLACAGPELNTRLGKIITDVMKNDVADSARQQAVQAKSQQEAAAALAALENKPLIITGKQPDGKDFTTADWKGKVILVDFWATWCGPCREELPRVTKLYANYHAKGLEVLGVSNDYSGEDLAKFLDKNKDMPWPQLFDSAAAANQSWNPITTGYGINGIPTMFLIDKKGVCRTVSARENMEDLIPKLLAEK